MKSAEDFPTRAFQDPWDMSQRTDVGWWTWGTDTAIGLNFLSPSVANGVFTGTVPANGPASLFLLDTPLPAAIAGLPGVPGGKNGQQFPLDASKYTHLVYRMSSTGAGVSQYVWSVKTWAEDMTLAVEIAQNATSVKPGWKIYDVDLSTLTTVAEIGTKTPWSGLKSALQFIPLANTPGATVQIDWARLVNDDPTLKKSITWTGGTADIYLDNDNNPLNGTLGRIAVSATSPYSFYVGALPAGQYFIELHAPTTNEVAGSAGGFAVSTGSYLVNDMPTIQFTTPSEEGSSTDFATTKLGDPWDFAQLTDVDSTLSGFSGRVNVNNPQITQIALTTEAGVNLGPQTVYLATSQAAGPGAANPNDGVGDPQLFTLFWDGKGKINKIDPLKYRIVTIEAGIPNKARSFNDGSIARLVWRAFNEPNTDGFGTKLQTVGQAYLINSAAGENTVSKVSVDMKNWPTEANTNLNTTWTSTIASSGGIDGFRFDPHEFSPATNFFVRRIKLAALERTQADQFTFKWTTSKTATVSIFYDNDPTHSFTQGTLACQVTNAPAGAGSCTWSVPAGLPNGEYQVYATINDGTNLNEVYARTNLVVDHSNTSAAVNLDKNTLYYSQLGSIHTDPQVVRLTPSGPGASPCWSATPNAAGLLTVSPASGCGAANISISATGFFPAGQTTTLFVAINPTGGQSWVAQNVAVNVTGLTSSNGPAGSMDTPADQSIVTGSVAVTGWAADDVEVSSVAICRDPVFGEATTPTLCAGQQQVFIGNATFVDGARPDIQTVFPTEPFNYRAGWGYLLLSNFLPNQGNGAVKLYAWAFDVDGHSALLGSKTINTDNVHATRPFGAIDTPGQGQVACGSAFINFGWALTQAGKDVLANSSTISVFVDGVNVGHPGARAARSDITAAFPSLDTSHAVGGFVLDTTQLSNGVHTIFWLVTDTGGQTDGVGSRFFTVSNPNPACGG